MINRILIRVKVVQQLYSYLISRNNFDIEATPAETTRERRFAHQIYLDLFLLLLRLSGYKLAGDGAAAPLHVHSKLSANKAIKTLNQNGFLRNLQIKEPERANRYLPIENILIDKIQSSKVFIDYAKRSSHELTDDAKLWSVILKTIISKDTQLEDLMRTFEGYSLNGFLRAVDMVDNALLQSAESKIALVKAQNELQSALTKSYELYLRLFRLILDLTAEQERRLEAAKSKYLATDADLNPNMRFVDNGLAKYLENYEPIHDLFKEYKIVAAEPGDPLVTSLLNLVLESELYKEYELTPAGDFAYDTEFWRTAMRSIIFPADELAEDLEDKSVYWNDDLYSMGTFFLKSLRQIATSKGEGFDILPKYKDEDDARFGADLFMAVVDNEDKYRALIDRFVNTSNWDSNRIALMDVVILLTAIAEIVSYPQIPLAVSINEYVEIANMYSTEKSGAFVNGILFTISNHLKSEGIIYK